MLFNSLVFPVFFVLFLCLYWPLRSHLRLQNTLTLLASYVFYGWWDVRFLALIVVSTAIDYGAGRVIDVGRLSVRERLLLTIFVLGSCAGVLVPWLSVFEGGSVPAESFTHLGVIAAGVVVYHGIYGVVTRLRERARRRAALAISVVSNLGILAIFKYLDFFIGSFAGAWEGLTGSPPDIRMLEIILPVGISFYTFQTMSYTIDVHRGKISSTTDGIAFAAYVAFFPQLVAGPIERASHLLGQFSVVKKVPNAEEIGSALWLIAWGFYKKLVIADNLAKSVNGVFGPYDQGGIAMDGRTDGLTFLFAVYAFAFQIYCDFSGYTDIARGTARLLGFDIMRNFNLPYFATSPSDFWRRWHISLSSWLRDYLYIPLGGNRGGGLFTYRNLMLTMLLGGLWHGAAWNFVLWGLFHGLILSIYRMLGARTEESTSSGIGGLAKNAMLWFIMLHLTMYGWLLFRAQNLGTIWIFTRDIVTNPGASFETWRLGGEILYYTWFLILFQIIQHFQGLEPLGRWHWFIRLNIWILVLTSLLRLSATGGSEFIYFAF